MMQFFLILIALVVPLFFVFVFLMSTRSRLGKCRERCREAEAAWRAGRSPESPDAAWKTWEAAAADYESARGMFPGRWAATLLGFAPAQRPAIGDSPAQSLTAGEGNPPR